MLRQLYDATFGRLRQWRRGVSLRSVAAVIAAVAAVAAVAVSVWTHYSQVGAARRIARQNGAIFEIVDAFGDNGASLSDITSRYNSTMPLDELPAVIDSLEDGDIRSVLLQLGPSVVFSAGRWYSSGNAPLSRVVVFIDDIAFGIPQIPDSYKARSLTADDVSNLLSPIENSTETVQLQVEEARRLNAITRMSQQAAQSPVSTQRAYSPSDIVALFQSGFTFYYEYTQWAGVAREWSGILRNDSIEPVQRINSFVDNELNSVLSGGAFFRALVGMAAIGMSSRENEDVPFSFAAEEGDCRGPGATGVRLIGPRPRPGGGLPDLLARLGGGEGLVYVLNWGSSMSVVANATADERRIDAARQLARLFEQACTESLGRVFESASEIFGREHVLINDYIDEWNRILAARRPASLIVTATIFNRGTHGTYVRRDVRAGIGARGGSEKVTLTLTSGEDVGGENSTTPYLAVSASQPSTYKFRASLEADDRERLYGAFVGGLNYIQIGVLALMGESNRRVYSPIAPFSEEAQERARMEIEDITIDF